MDQETNEMIDEINETDAEYQERLNRHVSKKVVLPVEGGMCNIEFGPFIDRTDNTTPSVWFVLTSDRKRNLYGPSSDGLFHIGSGSLELRDVKALHDLLGNFLNRNQIVDNPT